MPVENFSTFRPDDVTVLLSNITGMLVPKPAKQRERLIQSGVHYSEMLPLEYVPSQRYLDEYYRALDCFAEETARAVVTVSERIFCTKKEKTTLVSLARAGTPIGVLIKRYLSQKYGIKVPHYTISIVRGRGIDNAAMEHILNLHHVRDIQFVDGWTGKGAILDELYAALCSRSGCLKKRTLLAVLADPANVTDMCGTHDDIPIASSFLNSTVCGLMSRTVIRPGIGADELHGVAIFEELRGEDRTYEFIERIESHIRALGRNTEHETPCTAAIPTFGASGAQGLDEVRSIAERFGIKDINFVKPGIGEATRVLLRRIPDTVLIAEEAAPKYVAHLVQLAEEKNVPVIRYPLNNYKACGIIKTLSPDL